MVKKSYTSNYLKIYGWQGLSVLLNFLSMFIVVPRLASQPAIYGVYSVCAAMTIFFSYADLGFLTAGYKYASESFSRADVREEISILGFVLFVLLCFTILFSGTLLALSWKPGILISGMTSTETKTASSLFEILGIFSFVLVFQRWIQIVFGIRIEDYVFQRLVIAGSSLKILSVFFFFRHDAYDIVGYFLFAQIITTVIALACLRLVKVRFGYDVRFLLKSIKFSSEIFSRMRDLAFSAVYVTFCWVLFYELDSFAVSKLLGPQAVAFYAIGLTLTSLFRTIHGTIYSPFQARFNHFVGVGDFDGLRKLFLKLMVLTAPLVVLPVLSVVLLARNLVLSWVGSAYYPSIFVVQFLVLGYLYNFVSQPTGILVYAMEKISWIYASATLMSAVFWLGIYLSFGAWHLDSFAVFKFVGFSIAAVFYFIFSKKLIRISYRTYLKKVFLRIIPSAIVSAVSILALERYLPDVKGKINLLMVIGTGAGASLLGLAVYYFVSGDFRAYVREFLNRFFSKPLVEENEVLG